MITVYRAIALFQEYALQDPQTGETIRGAAVAPLLSFAHMGVMRWPITFCAAMVFILAGRSIWRIQQSEPGQARLARSTIDGSLFWGAYALALGVLATIIGFMVAAQSVEAVGRVETALVWGGVKVALSTTVYGLLIFLVAALVWVGLRGWHRRAVLAS